SYEKISPGMTTQLKPTDTADRCPGAEVVGSTALAGIREHAAQWRWLNQPKVAPWRVPCAFTVFNTSPSRAWAASSPGCWPGATPSPAPGSLPENPYQTPHRWICWW